MITQNKEKSLSERYKKYEDFLEKLSPKEIFNYLNIKRSKQPEYFINSNRSIDYLKKSNNAFNIWQLKEKYNQKIKNSSNRDRRIKQKIIRNYFSHDKKQKIKKTLLSKKKLLETLLDEERRKTTKNNIYSLNQNTHSNHIQNKGISIIDKVSMHGIEFGKRNIYKIKNKGEESNQSNTINFKKVDDNILMDKIYQIKMNKLALLKKIKFAELKNFCCKDIKMNSYNKNLGINNNLKQNNFNINNSNEIKINSIK